MPWTETNAVSERHHLIDVVVHNGVPVSEAARSVRLAQSWRAEVHASELQRNCCVRHRLALTRRDLDRALRDALARLEVTAGGSRPDRWSVPCVARSEHTVRFKYPQQVQPTVAMYRIPLLTEVFS